MEKIINIEQLKALRQTLPKDYVKVLAERAGCSGGSVRNVFELKKVSLETIEKVVNEAIKLAKETRQFQNNINEKLKKVTNE